MSKKFLYNRYIICFYSYHQWCLTIIIVDIYITYVETDAERARLKTDIGLATEYLKCLREVAGELSLAGDPDLPMLAAYRDIITPIDDTGGLEDLEEQWPSLKEAIGIALNDKPARVCPGRVAGHRAVGYCRQRFVKPNSLMMNAAAPCCCRIPGDQAIADTHAAKWADNRRTEGNATAIHGIVAGYDAVQEGRLRVDGTDAST